MLSKRPALALLATAFLFLTLTPLDVLAHDGEPPAPHDLWSAWSWEPGILLGLGITAIAYGQGVHTLWRRAGRGRGVSTRQTLLFAGGLLVVFAALVSPIDALSAAFFSAHRVQHMLLILIAAPLLVSGSPLAAVAWAVPKSWRNGLNGWRRRPALTAVVKFFSHTGIIWALHAGAIWFWHLPGPYEAAVENELVHALEHASFLGTALLFWWAVAKYFRQENGYGKAILYLFTMALQGGLLGSLITFSPAAWYDVHQATYWSLTVLEDQQLAGVIMWVPSGVVYLGAALGILGAWLLKAERQDQAFELPSVPQMPDSLSQGEGQAHASK